MGEAPLEMTQFSGMGPRLCLVHDNIRNFTLKTRVKILNTQSVMCFLDCMYVSLVSTIHALQADTNISIDLVYFSLAFFGCLLNIKWRIYITGMLIHFLMTARIRKVNTARSARY